MRLRALIDQAATVAAAEAGIPRDDSCAGPSVAGAGAGVGAVVPRRFRLQECDGGSARDYVMGVDAPMMEDHYGELCCLWEEYNIEDLNPSTRSSAMTMSTTVTMTIVRIITTQSTAARRICTTACTSLRTLACLRLRCGFDGVNL